jgi:glycosyltransferase involved in cell wall biosynthesis
MTSEIPFAAVIWDLQHRNNPWFPEVSSRGEWEGREKNYASLTRRASLLFTGTRRGRREIMRYYQISPDRIKILPFAAPSYVSEMALMPFDAKVLERLGVNGDYLYYPAQFWPHKNHVAVLEACKLVRERTGRDFKVVFSGSEKGNMAYVRDHARQLGLEHVVLFLGFVERAELVQLYRGAFCLVYATFCGPDNLPPLEAFALGCPVVASDVPGAKEQLGEAALLFSPSDYEDIAQKITRLFGDSVRAGLVQAGRARVRDLNWDAYAEKMIEALDEFSMIRRAWQ